MTQLADTKTHHNHPDKGMALPVFARALSDGCYEIVDANGASADAFGWMQDHIARVINTSSDLRLHGLIAQPVLVEGRNEWSLVDAGGNYIDETPEAAELVCALVNAYGGAI